jgi:hypothetical protein
MVQPVVITFSSLILSLLSSSVLATIVGVLLQWWRDSKLSKTNKREKQISEFYAPLAVLVNKYIVLDKISDEYLDIVARELSKIYPSEPSTQTKKIQIAENKIREEYMLGVADSIKVLIESNWYFTQKTHRPLLLSFLSKYETWCKVKNLELDSYIQLPESQVRSSEFSQIIKTDFIRLLDFK